jgi:hypothetical protein
VPGTRPSYVAEPAVVRVAQVEVDAPSTQSKFAVSFAVKLRLASFEPTDAVTMPTERAPVASA